MKATFYLLFFTFSLIYSSSSYAQESKAFVFEENRLEETINSNDFASSTIVKPDVKPFTTSKQPIQNLQTLPKKLKINKAQSPQKIKQAIKHLKESPSDTIRKDTTSKKFIQRLACSSKNSLEVFKLGIELTRFAKPPKAHSSEFTYILYVVYIIPLLLLIAAFLLVGISLVVFYSTMLGGLAFLIYWGILALLGISLSGLYLIWGLVGAFIVGFIFFLWLTKRC